MINVYISEKFNNINKINCNNCNQKGKFNFDFSNDIIVYITNINNIVSNDLPLFEKDFIKSINNDKVIRQKKSAYGLLKIAVKEILGINENFQNFAKTKQGKPYTSDYYFSISHSDNIVAVAISKCEIGIDIECISKDRKWDLLKRKIVNENEKNIILNSAEEIISLWTKKEAYFKLVSGDLFVPKNIDISNKIIKSLENIKDKEKSYILSIASNENKHIVVNILN